MSALVKGGVGRGRQGRGRRGLAETCTFESAAEAFAADPALLLEKKRHGRVRVAHHLLARGRGQRAERRACDLAEETEVEELEGWLRHLARRTRTFWHACFGNSISGV